MNGEYPDNRFLLPTPLFPVGNFLKKFGEHVTFPVAIRSFDTGNTIKDMKVVMHNEASAKVRGFKANGKLGMTVPEIIESLSFNDALKKSEISQMEKMDQQSILSNHSINHIQITSDPNGFIHIFNRTIIPLSGYRNTPIAIGTISLEVTQHTNLLNLLSIYIKYHHKKSKAVSIFLKYFNLHNFLNKTLSYEELRTLLAMIRDPRHKQIAQYLKLSHRTVGSYLASIKNKLKPNVKDIHMLLYNLREHVQLQYLPF